LDGGVGDDQMAGGAGDDLYVVDRQGDTVIELGGAGTDTVLTSISYTLAAGAAVEVLSPRSQSGTGAIDLVGNGFAQTIFGNNGANLLNGLEGIDIMIGLAGNDTYVVDRAEDQVLEAIGGGNDVIFTSVSYSLNSNQEIETLSTQTHAGTQAIDLVGNQLNNTLFGNNGANLLNGVDGADTMIGLGGNDTYAIDNAGDLVVEQVGGGSDLVFTSISHTLTNGNEVETLSTVFHQGTTAIDLGGNDYANHLIGNYGNNYLNGGGGADVMTGFFGNDTYVVDNAGDQVEEAGGAGSDTLFSFVSYTLAANQEVEVLSTAFQGGTAAINLTGNNLAQTVYGNAGANVLNGGAGIDTLVGFGGADTYAFTTALGASNVDVLADMISGSDKIALDDAIFTTIGGPGTLGANACATGTAAGDADDRIIYNQATGALYYDADGSGGGAMIQFATLTGAPALAASDFLII
jgi:Ca2+-binding RTX toxin-like protein